MMVTSFAGLLCGALSQGGLWVADVSPHMHERAWSDGAQMYWCVEQNPLPFFAMSVPKAVKMRNRKQGLWQNLVLQPSKT